MKFDYKARLFAAITIAIGCIAPMAAGGGNDKTTVSPEQKKYEDSIKNLYKRNDAWVKEIISLQDTVAQFKSATEALNARENDLNALEASITPRIEELDAREKSLKEKEEEFSQQLRKMHEANAKLCDIRLQQPYRSDRIDEAVEIYKTIDFDCIDRYRTYYEGLGAVLENYPKYYRELLGVIETIQADNGRKFKSENYGFRDKCKERIYATEYYKNYYKPKKGGKNVVTIPYLDSVIDNFIKLLDNTKAGEFDFEIFLNTFLPAPK